MNIEVGTMTAPHAIGAVTSLVTSCCPAGNLKRVKWRKGEKNKWQWPRIIVDVYYSNLLKPAGFQTGIPLTKEQYFSKYLLWLLSTYRICRSCVKVATAVPCCVLFCGKLVLICSKLGCPGWEIIMVLYSGADTEPWAWGWAWGGCWGWRWGWRVAMWGRREGHDMNSLKKKRVNSLSTFFSGFCSSFPI